MNDKEKDTFNNEVKKASVSNKALAVNPSYNKRQTIQEQEKKDHYWRNFALAFVFLFIYTTTTNRNDFLVMTVSMILALEYFHKRYIDDIKEILEKAR